MAHRELRRLARIQTRAYAQLRAYGEQLKKSYSNKSTQADVKSVSGLDSRKSSPELEVETLPLASWRRWEHLAKAEPVQIPKSRQLSCRTVIESISNFYHYLMDAISTGADLRMVYENVESTFDILAEFLDSNGAPAGHHVRKKTTLDPSTLTTEGQLWTFISQCALWIGVPRVRIFLNFFLDRPLGAEPGHAVKPYGVKELIFAAETLEMIRKLLDVNASDTFQHFHNPSPAPVPLACVLDVVCNFYNVNDPIQVQLSNTWLPKAISKDEKLGHCVDIDDILAVFLEEYSGGEIPRSAVRFPRHTMDGKTSPNLTAGNFLDRLRFWQKLSGQDTSGKPRTNRR